MTAAPAHNQQQGYAPLPAKGHKESVYALAMNDAGTILVSGGTEKVSCTLFPCSTLKISTGTHLRFGATDSEFHIDLLSLIRGSACLNRLSECGIQELGLSK